MFFKFIGDSIMNFLIKMMVVLLIILFSFSCIFLISDNSFEEEKKYYQEYKDNFDDFIKENIIRLEFIFDKKIDYSRIKIKVKNSVITLTGSVDNQDSLDYIIKRIENLSISKAIISEIKIGGQEVEIPIEYENEINNSQFYKKARAFKLMFFDIFHYKNKLLFDLPLNTSFIETANEYSIALNMPSMKYKDISILIKNNDLLIIKGKIKTIAAEDAEYFSLVQSYNLFEKSVILPNYCDIKKAKAFLKKQTLIITIPRLQ